MDWFAGLLRFSFENGGRAQLAVSGFECPFRRALESII